MESDAGSAGRVREVEKEEARSKGAGGRRKKNKYNPRRHLEVDDFESVLPAPRRPPTPPGRPITPPKQTAPPAGRQEPVTSMPGARGKKRQHSPVRNGRAATWGPVERRLPTRVRGVMLSELVEIPTNPAVDPEPYHCFNYGNGGTVPANALDR